jgi:hypothetical protein
MLEPDILVHFYRLPVCQSRIWSSRSSETDILQRFHKKTRFASFITMMYYSTPLCTRGRSYPRWIVLTKTKPPTLLHQTDIGNEASCDILLSSKGSRSMPDERGNCLSGVVIPKQQYPSDEASGQNC